VLEIEPLLHAEATHELDTTPPVGESSTRGPAKTFPERGSTVFCPPGCGFRWHPFAGLAGVGLPAMFRLTGQWV
jgi:hypothetical protein